MTFDDFKRNLRGVNDGTDFSAEFLVSYIHQWLLVLTESSKRYMTVSKSERS
jgi:hypothetical protein